MRVSAIYKITSPTGSIYIGQTVDVVRRFSQYRRLDMLVKTSPKLYKSLINFGYDAHTFEIIEKCEIGQLKNKERHWQDFYNATSESNLNCILTKSDTKKGVGIAVPNYRKAQISAVHKGKVYSEETKAKIRIARAKQVITAEHRRKISENSGSARIVINLLTGIYYITVKEAAMSIGIKSNALQCSLMGRNKKNQQFKFA
jgi:group I intron endonuclease